jgi:hypothetical protein
MTLHSNRFVDIKKLVIIINNVIIIKCVNM